MKKLSISLFAVLAIAFAVTSAFTTTMKKARTDEELWSFASTSGYTSSNLPSDMEQRYDFVNDPTKVVDINGSAASTTIAQFKTAIDKFCDAGSALCIIRVLQEPGTGPQADGNGEAVVGEVEFGTLTPNEP